MRPQAVDAVVRRARRLREVGSFVVEVARNPTQRKHLTQWLRSLRAGYLLNEPSPWISFDAIDYVRGYLDRLRPAGVPLKVFEYGSGGSTLFWQSRGLECVSIEHDPKWFSVVHERITSPRVNHRLIAPQPGSAGGDPSDPLAYLSDAEEFRGYSFRAYVEAIDEFPDAHFDIILVDGRARPSCIMHAAKKMKGGGILIVDNAEREYYMRHTRDYLRGFETHEFWGALPLNTFFTRTDVHRKAD
jgi:hypothetical protein